MTTSHRPRSVSARVTSHNPLLPPGTTPSGMRGRVLRAALELYAKQGFHGTSIRDIGAAAGTNSATLYSHYPSKEHLLADLVLIGHTELYERLRAALGSVGLDPTSQLTALVRAHVKVHAEFPLLAVVTNSELYSLSPELASTALELRERSWQMLVTVIEHGVATGQFEVDDIELASRAISAFGVRVGHWFDQDSRHTPDQVADSFTRYALRIVAA